MKDAKQKPPVQKGDKITVEIHGLGHSGEGVARLDGYTLFIEGALQGEQVTAKVKEVKKSYGRAQLLEVLEAAPERIAPPCPVYQACGGCQLQHLSYEGQLAAKYETVRAALERIGKLAGVTIQPVLPSPESWHYRNKMLLPIGRRGRHLIAGCYAQGSHEIVPMEACLIQHEANNRIAAAVAAVATELRIKAYEEATGEGSLRYAMGRVGVATDEVMVVVVTATEELPEQEAFIKGLQERIPGLVSILQNVNSRKTNVMLGPKNKLLWGKEYIEDKLGNLTFQISPHSFFQVNTKQAVRLYETALKYADLQGEETVIDAYCGTGTISLFLAQQAKKVYGIEVVAPAIADAKKNAADNKIDNVEFLVGDATDVMPKLYRDGLRPDVVVVDPPRAGCSTEVLDTFVRMEPNRIVYVSCNPASLARDLGYLAEEGYEAKEIQPVDMFPMTYHVECVALIQRRTT
ncbi:MAG: 23S rRNA (uracil(1939)-C(5))-methyltransferase RlmD [Sporomusaceae bacterium]|nr:23S rRNA (uracil(1939)-C(5))-methyltransferase RlmD [Sporomusaceae bacterium]